MSAKSVLRNPPRHVSTPSSNKCLIFKLVSQKEEYALLLLLLLLGRRRFRTSLHTLCWQRRRRCCCHRPAVDVYAHALCFESHVNPTSAPPSAVATDPSIHPSICPSIYPSIQLTRLLSAYKNQQDFELTPSTPMSSTILQSHTKDLTLKNARHIRQPAARIHYVSPV